MSFGRMPIANGFLTPGQFADEHFFELAPAFCGQCAMFQIVDQPAPEMMFHADYAFFSGTSRYMQTHFRTFADQVGAEYLRGREDPFVVEMGSNDGIMLGNFAAAGIRHLGIEPSENVARVARQNGVATLCKFFDSELARRIVEEHGQADAVLGANVMCHIPDLNSVAEGIGILLKPDGVLIFEDPYLGDMIEKTAYDQIYDEHVFIFSATSVARAFGAHGLDLIAVGDLGFHGGSMRFTLSPTGRRPISATVDACIARERALGLERADSYEAFRESCEASRDGLIRMLDDFCKDGKRVAGYGATSKSTTVMNYCAITPEHIEFVSDTTPTKQGKFTPGTHVPVMPHEAFAADYPDYALLFAWNHMTEIMEKEAAFRNAGGQWIVYVPEIKVFQ